MPFVHGLVPSLVWVMCVTCMCICVLEFQCASWHLCQLNLLSLPSPPPPPPAGFKYPGKDGSAHVVPSNWPFKRGQTQQWFALHLYLRSCLIRQRKGWEVQNDLQVDACIYCYLAHTCEVKERLGRICCSSFFPGLRMIFLSLSPLLPFPLPPSSFFHWTHQLAAKYLHTYPDDFQSGILVACQIDYCAAPTFHWERGHLA